MYLIPLKVLKSIGQLIERSSVLFDQSETCDLKDSKG